MLSENHVNIPILTPLVPDGVRPGTIFLVEFDPESQWLAVATTIAAGFLRGGGCVSYVALLRSAETVRENLIALGVDPSTVTSEGRFVVDDLHTASLAGGKLDRGGVSVIERIDGGTNLFFSLKVSDLSVEYLKDIKQGPTSRIVWENWPPGALSIADSMSQMLRFNEEKPYLEWAINRNNPGHRSAKRIAFLGFVRGIHSESFYKRLENDVDGVIDLRVMERNQEWKNLLCIRSLKGQPHDSRWHEIKVNAKGEATLVT